MKEEVKNENEMDKISPSQYFDFIKGAKKTISTDLLKESYGPFVKLAEKYEKLGQNESLKKLCFLADVLLKEEKLIELGITTFVYKDVIEDYIQNVADNTVKIVELSRYMREIPDELVETIEKSREIFDELYVVFTDYTGREERKVERERRDKDPILFGVFKTNNNISDRFYFLGDWVDEYCDLTLDKMVEQYKEKKEVSPLSETSIPKNTEELVELMKSYSVSKDDTLYKLYDNVTISPEYRRLPVTVNEQKKESFFKKVRGVFSKK